MEQLVWNLRGFGIIGLLIVRREGRFGTRIDSKTNDFNLCSKKMLGVVFEICKE